MNSLTAALVFLESFLINFRDIIQLDPVPFLDNALTVRFYKPPKLIRTLIMLIKG